MERKRGRPPYSPSKAVRENVEMYLACGLTQEQICAALSIDHKTFTKAFAVEIDTGRGKARARVLTWLQKSAKNGNVSAQKKLEEMSRLADAAAEFDRPAKPAGKKEQQQADAVAAAAGDNDWGDDLNPHSVN